MSKPLLTPGLAFSGPITLKGLEVEGEQFTIKSDATVTARVMSQNKTTELITWTAQPRANAGSNWLVSRPVIEFDAVATALITSYTGTGVVQVRVAGEIVDQDLTGTGVTYDKIWDDALIDIGESI